MGKEKSKWMQEKYGWFLHQAMPVVRHWCSKSGIKMEKMWRKQEVPLDHLCALSTPFLSHLSSFLDYSAIDEIGEYDQSGSRKGTNLQRHLKNNFSPLRQDTKNLREEVPILFVMFLLWEATIFWLGLG